MLEWRIMGKLPAEVRNLSSGRLLDLRTRMDGAKKTAKNTFSVPCAKKQESQNPSDSTSILKVKEKKKKTEKENKPQCNQTKAHGKAAVSTTQKDKKLACKNDQTVKTEDKEKKQVSNRSKQSTAKKVRTLTDAEYEDIFKAVISIDLSVCAEEDQGEPQALCEDVYTALTQEDSQDESEAKEADDGTTAEYLKDKQSACKENNTQDNKHPHSTLAGHAKPSADKDQASDTGDGQTLKNNIRRDDSFEQSETAKSKGSKSDTADGKTAMGQQCREKVKRETDVKKESNSKEEDHAQGDGTKKGREKQHGRETGENRRKAGEENVSKNKKEKEQPCEKLDTEGENEGGASEAEKTENNKLSRGKKGKEKAIVEMTSEAEENDDAVSVVSNQSISSSLLDMAVEVDQWDRPEDIQQNNEHTPQASDAETEPHAGTPTIAQKPKKVKRRENQLAPRKLCFDAPVAQKSTSSTKELPKKKVKPNQKSQASVPEVEKKKKSFKLEIKQDLRSQNQKEKQSSQEEIPAEWGTWVQCCKPACKKWRYLPDVHDPVQVHDLWVCSMHPDTLYNSCDKAEQQYDESDHIFTQFTLGSVVWAKVDGFPWWPAIVDTDPDYDVYCELPNEDSMVPTDYHVVFLDEKVTRTWVKKNRIKQMMLSQLAVGSSFLKGHKYKKEVGVAMRKAELALNTPLEERVDKFGFAACFRNVNTRWTKAPEKKRQPKHKRGQKRVCKGGQNPPAARKVRNPANSSDDDSDSDLDSPNTGYSPDSDISSQSSSDHNASAGHREYQHESDTVAKKRTLVSSLARRQVRKKLKVRDGVHDSSKESKVTKKLEVGETGSKRKVICKNDHRSFKAKKLKFRAPMSAGCVENSESNEEVLLKKKSGLEDDEEISLKNILTLQNDEEISFKRNAGMRSDEEISFKNMTDQQKGKEVSFKKNSGLGSDEELVFKHGQQRSELEAELTEVTDVTEVEDPTEVENSTEEFKSRNSSDDSDEKELNKAAKLKKKPFKSDKKHNSKSSSEAQGKKIGDVVIQNSEDVKIPEDKSPIKDIKLNREVSETKKKKKAIESKIATGTEGTTLATQSTGKKRKKLFKSENVKKPKVDQEKENKETKPEPAALDTGKTQIETEKREEKGSIKKSKACKKKDTDVAVAGTNKSSLKKPKLDEDSKKKKLNHKPPKPKSDLADKKTKMKPQKFVIPAKLMPETSAVKTKSSLCSANTSLPVEDMQKMSELDPPLTKAGEVDEARPKLPRRSSQQDDPSPQTKKRKKMFSRPVQSQDSIKDTLHAVDSDENDSPLLSPQNRDQFVPSMDSESDNLNADIASDDNNTTGKEASEKREVMEAGKGFAEGDSDSDCLDIDEDIPIPSLQQVLSVEGKGCSDQEGADSDPLEMADD